MGVKPINTQNMESEFKQLPCMSSGLVPLVFNLLGYLLLFFLSLIG